MIRSQTVARPSLRPGRTGTGVTLGLIASMAFATSGPFARPLLDSGWTPGAAVLWRVGLAALVLLPPALWVMRGRLAEIAGQWRAIATFGALAVATPALMFFAAVSRMEVSIALLIEYMAPVLLVLLAWARSRRAPSPMVLAGTGTSVLGLVCVLDPAGATPDALGMLFALGGMIGAASYFVLSARPTSLHPLALAAFGLLAGALVLAVPILTGLLPYAASFDPVILLGQPVAWWIPMAVVAMVATAGAYGLGVAGISLMGERLASFVGLSEVLFAALLAALLLGEVPNPIQLVGSGLIIAGVALIRASSGQGSVGLPTLADELETLNAP